jgi:hypothetical protein
MFAPELWGQVVLFSKLYSETYKFSEREQRALAGVTQHFEKATMFQWLAVKLRPNLNVDQAELNERGFTPANNARELAMVIEAAVLELYSSVDCTAQVLHAIYGRGSRGLKKSTRSFFGSFDGISGSFPDAIKDIMRGVSWYEELLYIRDELTHLGTGSCHLDETTANVRYMHIGVKIGGGPLILDDIFTWLSLRIEAVNTFFGQVFRFLRSTLQSTPVVQFCGIVEGRMLMRYVDPTQDITFASGTCFSYRWFEQPDAAYVPLR